MASRISDAVGIIDMDGFLISKRFYCKELGLMRVGDTTARSVFFDIGVRWDELSAKDKKTCGYVMRKIHKLPFGVPCGVEASEVSALENIVKSFYCEVKQNESSVLAYKGGQYERDLLASLAVPPVNLENFGCLKAGKLFNDSIWLEMCGNHTVNEAFWHCPKVEVEG